MVKSVNTNKVEMVKKAAAAVVFENPEFGKIRTLTDENGEPLFCAKDVCDVLGYKIVRCAVTQPVNTLDAVKHSVKLSGRLRKDGTPSNAMVISSLSRICVMPFSDTPSFEDRYASFFLSSVGYHHAESEHIFFEVLLVDGIVLEQGTVVIYGLGRIRQDAGYL